MALKSKLGPLELTIMNIMWKAQSSTVRHIHDEISKEREIALTTVSTTMNRLYKKDLLSREVNSGKGGLYYIYKTKVTKGIFEEKESKNIATQLIKSFGSSATLKIVGELSKNYTGQELDSLMQELEKLKSLKNQRKKKP
jgi:predicted transcriptional regulator